MNNGKYYGKYRGVVIDNDDGNHPDGERRGRIRVQIPTIFTCEPDILTAARRLATTGGIVASDEYIKSNTPSVWAEPCFPYGGKEVGFNFMPAHGALVWIEFEAGDLNYPIWVGIWTTPSAGEGKVPIEFTSPDQRIIRTDTHWMMFDDTVGAEKFYYKHLISGIEITLDHLGDATINITRDKIIDITRDHKEDVGQDNLITIGRDKDVQITGKRTDQIGTTWDMTTGGKVTENYGGDWTVNITGDVTITPTGFIKLLAPAMKEIELGANQDSLVVTTQSLCPLTGAPHMMGAQFIKAKNFT